MRVLVVLSIAVVLTGCSGGTTELSVQQDKELRHNFARELTPDEISRMGGGPKPDPAKAESAGAQSPKSAPKSTAP